MSTETERIGSESPRRTPYSSGFDPRGSARPRQRDPGHPTLTSTMHLNLNSHGHPGLSFRPCKPGGFISPNRSLPPFPSPSVQLSSGQFWPQVLDWRGGRVGRAPWRASPSPGPTQVLVQGLRPLRSLCPGGGARQVRGHVFRTEDHGQSTGHGHNARRLPSWDCLRRTLQAQIRAWKPQLSHPLAPLRVGHAGRVGKGHLTGCRRPRGLPCPALPPTPRSQSCQPLPRLSSPDCAPIPNCQPHR